MRIIGVETVNVAQFGNAVWVRLHTDEGAIGLGETFRNPEATIAYIHETCAPFVIGKDPTRREWLMALIAERIGNHFTGFPTRSVETRGNSAIDLALWDLCGQALGVPVHTLLGGKVRDRIRIYNTCAGDAYNNRVRAEYNTELVSRDGPAPGVIGRHEDLLMQVFEPARLARELLDDGITAMKIWPFDVFALRNNGEDISAEELRQALWPVEEIRKAVGDAMDIMIEFHGLWRLPAAIRIARALADFGIYWYEDPIAMHAFDDLARYHDVVEGWVAGSENLGTVPWYRETFGRGAVDVANFDMAWVGGLSEGVRIAHLAEAFGRPVAPHDCTGPVTLIANVHLLAAAPNGLMAETVRSHLAGFYHDIVTDLPRVEAGFIYAGDAPGWGAALRDEIFTRDDVRVCLTGEAARE